MMKRKATLLHKPIDVFDDDDDDDDDDINIYVLWSVEMV